MGGLNVLVRCQQGKTLRTLPLARFAQARRGRRERIRPDFGASQNPAGFPSRLRREARRELWFQVRVMGGGDRKVWGSEVVWGLEEKVWDMEHGV